MILLLAFSFVAGVVTILSPCILPVLPIILSSTVGGVESGRRRPLGVTLGFVVSFTFFTLFLSLLVRTIGIPADALRLFSIAVIGLFGASILIPQTQVFLERFFSRLTRFAPHGDTGTGFWSGIVVGISLGLLWTPCVGPILASVIALALTGTVTLATFGMTLAYAIGTAIPMLLIMVGGRGALARVPWLQSHTGAIQKVFGVLMIVTAIAIATNLDRKFQTYIITRFPGYGAGLTSLEDRPSVQKAIEGLEGSDEEDSVAEDAVRQARPHDTKNAARSTPAPKKQYPRAPEIIAGGQWFNSDPLTLAGLRGKVVVIDFWTYSCINCQRTLPYLRRWHTTYKDKGLVIIGVHAPEFEFEKSSSNVKKAIADFQLTYPIVQDNDFQTWRAYKNRYWPAKYFIDKDGYVRYSHFGEGAYDESEEMIRALLEEAGATMESGDVENPTYENYARTPEIYLGSARMEYNASPETLARDALATYSAPATLPRNQFALSGAWVVTSEYAAPRAGARLTLNFESKEVFLVMRPSHGSAKVRVLVDGQQQYLGADAVDGRVTVDADRLYTLVALPTPGQHTLTLEFEDDSAELYAFTFG
ncbi:redoxin domain-containing protein [Candidatus Uhrbacteria bacterium]|nr:redoxin domain-containing protein [Candidatus Uhrbacteria bacterium]